MRAIPSASSTWTTLPAIASIVVPGGSGSELPKPGVSMAHTSKCGASKSISAANMREDRPEAASSISDGPVPVLVVWTCPKSVAT